MSARRNRKRAPASSDAPIVKPRTLASDRVLLRPYRNDEAQLLYDAAIESLDTVGRWMPWCHDRYAIAESVAWVESCAERWRSGVEYAFGIFDHAGRYIGGCGLNGFNRMHNFANLGYWIRQSRQRQGYAVDAVHTLSMFGFTTLRLTRIEIVVASENAPSRRVAEKAGATFECIARNRLLIRDVPHSAAVYSLIPGE
ncbi:MAG TPA: GNAT family N-acetyltransferase [Casimicrobiaceae bacterium]|nr:GNAT family N-acetyltransferase [Casimicrobiaceae bacterium]